MKIFKNWLSCHKSQSIINGPHVFKSLEDMCASELVNQLRLNCQKLMANYILMETFHATFSKEMYFTWKIWWSVIGEYFLHDREFKISRDALNSAKMSTNWKKAHLKMVDNRICYQLSQDNEEKLWNTEILGIETPKQLIRILESFLTIRWIWAKKWKKDERYYSTLPQTEMGEALVKPIIKKYCWRTRRKTCCPKARKSIWKLEKHNPLPDKLYKLYAEKR